MAWLDFNQIEDDLVSLLQTEVSAAQLVKKECDDRDYAFHNFPLIDVRLTDMDPQVRAGRDYYVFLTFEVQVSVHDLSGFDEAATLRNTVLTSAIDAVRNNANFSASVETSIIGAGTFDNAKDDETGQFMAAGTFQVVAQAFVDA